MEISEGIGTKKESSHREQSQRKPSGSASQAIKTETCMRIGAMVIFPCAPIVYGVP